MKNNIGDDPIRAYLNGTLPQPEREALEKTLGEEPEFAGEVARRRVEMAAAELLIAADTRQLFQQWQVKNRSSASWPNRRPLFWLIGLATGLLLLFAISRLVRPPVTLQAPVPAPAASPGPEQPPALQQPVAVGPEKPAVPVKRPATNYWLLAQKQLPDPMSTNLRRTVSDSSLSIFQQAQRAYTAGQYQQTLDLLAQTDTSRQQSAAFLSAHALFQLRRLDAAAAQFERLITRNSRQFRLQSEWGLLMCYLADYPQRRNLVHQQLDRILEQPQHPYFERATALAKTLAD